MTKHSEIRLLDRALLTRAVDRLLPEAPPAPHGEEPRDVRRRGRRRPRDARPPRGRDARIVLVPAPGRPLALGHGPLRELRRGRRRGARQGAGRRAPADEERRRWPGASSAQTAARSTSPLRALRKGDLVVVEAGQLIPGDGTVVEGIASVDESAITGESAPVIREAGGDRSAVTGGTKVLSDRIVVEITSEPGSTFLDRMIRLVEGAERQKTPNEIALDILLAGLTIVFLFATVTLRPFALYSGSDVSPTVLVALLVCLIPTTIGGLLSAIGIAGMDRVLRHNVLAMSGRAVEASGDVNVLLLDKTGTITLGNRQATQLLPGARRLRARAGRAGPARLARRRDTRGALDRRPRQGEVRHPRPRAARPPRPLRPLHGADADVGPRLRRGPKGPKGGGRRRRRLRPRPRRPLPGGGPSRRRPDRRRGGTPLVVADGGKVAGTIYLKDVVKGGMKERFDRLRAMGIRTVMITGDNPLTAASIAREAGVDDFLAEATPEDKLALIRKEQANGNLVAMTGDGTNDAPALAQADVGMAMNTGTQAAKEAGNMVDLDSNPTKLIEVVEIGKQLLMTRGALTTFSIANDVAKYFAILPALFVATFPELKALNIMQLATPESAILSAVIFNALIIVALIPLALRGVSYRPLGAARILRRNLLIYGLGGLVAPFVGIKAIDLLLVALKLA